VTYVKEEGFVVVTKPADQSDDGGLSTKAIVWTRYGPPEGLQLREVAKPRPRSGDLLIKIHATTAAAGDCELPGLRFSIGLRILVRVLFGFSRPRAKILGQEFAGEVEAVGPGVHQFHEGDQVFGTTGFGFGAYAEYICLSESAPGRALAIKPTNMSYEEAAAVPTGGLEAVHFLRRAGNLKGRSVLINGAGGRDRDLRDPDRQIFRGGGDGRR
jgi:NADPH:quinone reductase-like Zn-dependent oxidoreductase